MPEVFFDRREYDGGVSTTATIELSSRSSQLLLWRLYFVLLRHTLRSQSLEFRLELARRL